MKEEKLEEYVIKEKRILDLEYEFIQDFIKFRKDNHLTQQQMADQAHVIRETIARIENYMTSPQINTLLKILKPLGYTLKIAKVDKKSNK